MADYVRGLAHACGAGVGQRGPCRRGPAIGHWLKSPAVDMLTALKDGNSANSIVANREALPSLNVPMTSTLLSFRVVGVR